MHKASGKLNGVAETLLIPLAFRAIESQEPKPILMDSTAGPLANELGLDITRFRNIGHDRVFTMMRAREFDRRAREFLTEFQCPVVVEIGCGLDNRLARVDDGQAEWYQIDLPEVMALRSSLAACRTRGTSIVGSVLEAGWMGHVAYDPKKAFLFLAEGVFRYFSDGEVKGLVLTLRDHYPGCRLIFDALSPLLAWIERHAGGLRQAANQVRWTLKEDAELESWGDGIRLLGRWTYFEEAEPRLRSFGWMRALAPLADAARVVRYQLGIRG